MYVCVCICIYMYIHTHIPTAVGVHVLDCDMFLATQEAKL